MFVEFYYVLRDNQIPVSITEFLTFMEALSKGLIHSGTDFYYTSRSILVKDEKWFDQFDQSFSFYFGNSKVPDKIREDILNWLDKPAPSFLDKLSPEERKWIEEMIKNNKLEELHAEFLKRLEEQTEEHNGGSHWIGTQGTSPFGWGGVNPFGIRVGGQDHNGMAVKIAQKRKFQNYRNDLILDTRQIQLALRKLRKLSKIGAPDVLNLDESIKATCKNGGEIEIIMDKERKNNVKLILFMDVGGSMDPFALMVSQLFSAASKCGHFHDFKYYYFHNCIYDNLFEDITLEKKVPTASVLNKYDSDYRVMLVGDAAMAFYELTNRFGAIDYFQLCETTGLDWLQRVRKHFPKSVWLNPEVVGAWMADSRKMVSRIFPMFQLTLDGLDEAIRVLI